jgi:hypothetical protein
MPNLHTKNKRLTKYGLSCGYIEHIADEKNAVTMLMEHGMIRVEVFEFDTHFKNSISFDRIKSARIQFKVYCDNRHLKFVPKI